MSPHSKEGARSLSEGFKNKPNRWGLLEAINIVENVNISKRFEAHKHSDDKARSKKRPLKRIEVRCLTLEVVEST